ncbi:MAG: endolytic transglycosylase MltG [Patescibacteria group bacterium]
MITKFVQGTIKGIIKFIVTLGVVAAVLGFIWYSYEMNKDYTVRQQQVEISPGLGVKQISAELELAGLIHNDFVFRTYVWQKGLEEDFIAGVFDLPETMSQKDLVDILTSHNTIDNSIRITLIEGWSVDEIAETVSETLEGVTLQDVYVEIGFPQTTKNNANGQTYSNPVYEEEYVFLQDRPEGTGYEGYVFPDTYIVKETATVEDVVRKAFDNFDVKFSEEMRRDVVAQGRTIYEVVTIASILEREFQTLEDKKVGAGIIQNRLDIGMALQMDSTVNYVTGKRLPAVTFEDLEVDSPYNTYMYPGLPPGPIASPGLDSLIAAVYPDTTSFLYFLHDPAGNTHFAETFDQHVANKAKYLQ